MASKNQLHSRVYDKVPRVMQYDKPQNYSGYRVFLWGKKWVCLGEMTHRSEALIFLLNSNQSLAQSKDESTLPQSKCVANCIFF